MDIDPVMPLMLTNQTHLGLCHEKCHYFSMNEVSRLFSG